MVPRRGLVRPHCCSDELNLGGTGWILLPGQIWRLFQIDHVGHDIPSETRGAGTVRRSEPRAGTLSRWRVRLVGQVYDLVHMRSGRHDGTSIIEPVTGIPPLLDKMGWEKSRICGTEGLALMVPRRLVPIREFGHFTMRSLTSKNG